MWLMRIPIDVAHHSGMMSPAIPRWFRPLFRDDVAHHSGMISPGVGRLCWPTQVRSFGLQRRTGCQQRGRPCATCAKFCGWSWCEAVCESGPAAYRAPHPGSAVGPGPEGKRGFALLAGLASAPIDAMLLYSFVREW